MGYTVKNESHWENGPHCKNNGSQSKKWLIYLEKKVDAGGSHWEKCVTLWNMEYNSKMGQTVRNGSHLQNGVTF